MTKATFDQIEEGLREARSLSLALGKYWCAKCRRCHLNVDTGPPIVIKCAKCGGPVEERKGGK